MKFPKSLENFVINFIHGRLSSQDPEYLQMRADPWLLGKGCTAVVRALEAPDRVHVQPKGYPEDFEANELQEARCISKIWVRD